MKNQIETLDLSQIAQVVRGHWSNIYFGAVPYLNAMATLQTLDDKYGHDTGRSIVIYFLSNARTWKGDVARAVKAELNFRLKTKKL